MVPFGFQLRSINPAGHMLFIRIRSIYNASDVKYIFEQ